MRKVMVLEDEASIRSFIVINLRRAGYEVVEAETGEEALDKLHANPDTLVALLDVMLPKLDGFTVLRRLRAEGSTTPVLMLTARSELTDRVNGLDSGADYYLTKPFALEELEARELLGRAAMVENCGLPGERMFADLTEKPDSKGYFTTVIIP